MVSKGHDFKDVTAVGILTADSVLNIPVYTASERTFDLHYPNLWACWVEGIKTGSVE